MMGLFKKRIVILLFCRLKTAPLFVTLLLAGEEYEIGA